MWTPRGGFTRGGHQAPEKFLAALTVLGAAWQSWSHFNPKFIYYYFFFFLIVGLPVKKKVGRKKRDEKYPIPHLKTKIFYPPPALPPLKIYPSKKSKKIWSPLVLVLLSTADKRFSVSRMRDFYELCQPGQKKFPPQQNTKKYYLQKKMFMRCRRQSVPNDTTCPRGGHTRGGHIRSGHLEVDIIEVDTLEVDIIEVDTLEVETLEVET